MRMGNRSTIVFVTVCTHQRKRVLANDQVHELLLEYWSDTSHWTVGRYVILPDHIHLFCSPARPDSLVVRKWIQYWKSRASTNWPTPHASPIFQPEAWDRQLRSGDSYGEKWVYVRENPVRHGLVDRWDEWAYQGELEVLDWHDI